MSNTTINTYVGRGTVYLASYDGTIPYTARGNCSKLAVAVTEKKLDMPDYQNPGGGMYDSVHLIDSVGISASLMEPADAVNLALGTFGTSGSTVGAAVANEPLAVPTSLGTLIPFAQMPDLGQPVTVKDSTGTTTYVAGTDYIVTRSGIIPLTGGAIATGASLKVSYMSASTNTVETLTKTGQQYKLLFEGLNEAQSGKSVLVFVHKIKFSPAKEMALISDAWSQLDIDGECLKDLSITAPGVSQYVSIKMQQ